MTHQPCVTCAKELIQAGIARAFYMIELPVGLGAPTDPINESKERDEALARLKETQSRLMGQLKAVPVDPGAVVAALEGATDRFNFDVKRAAELSERG